MKKIASLVLCLSFLCAPALLAAPAKDAKEVMDVSRLSGYDWLELSIGDRNDAIVSALIDLTKNGVKPQRSPNDYYDEAEKRLIQDPNFGNETLESVLTAIIYDGEPANRTVLDKLKNQSSLHEASSKSN